MREDIRRIQELMEAEGYVTDRAVATSVYLATGLTTVPTDRQGIEERYMRVEHVPLARFDQLVDHGAIVDSTTILGVGLARRRLEANG